uniref:glycosyltransferase n=1 Tax=Clostridium sp. TaxID=1506 RepID=UPI002617F138
MKILYVITGLSLGGAERVVADLADQMTLLGHNVKIAYLTGDVLVQFASSDVEIIALHLNSVKDFLPASKKYQRLIKSFSPDVVHAHMVHANLF